MRKLTSTIGFTLAGIGALGIVLAPFADIALNNPQLSPIWYAGSILLTIAGGFVLTHD